jgi:hypothetical protein
MKPTSLRWTSLLLLAALAPACSDAVTPVADASTNDAAPVDAIALDVGTADAGTADAGTADAGTADAGTADAGTAVDVAIDAPVTCAGATNGAACSVEGQTCGGPCSDPCRFCNLLQCSGGRWMGVEVSPKPCDDAGAADAATPAPGARMLWQAPGGFAGTGPAVMVDADGTVRVWDSTRGVELASPSAPSRTEHVTPAAAADLFARWARVDRAGLPHAGGAGECSGLASYRACADASCRVDSVMFTAAAQITPEMNEVRSWFDDNLAGDTMAHPADYCRF